MSTPPAQNVALQPGGQAAPLNQAVTAALANAIGYVFNVDIQTATAYIGGAALIIGIGVSLSTNKAFIRIISGNSPLPPRWVEYIGGTFIGCNYGDLTAYFDGMEVCVADFGLGNTSPASFNGVPTMLVPNIPSLQERIYLTLRDTFRRHEQLVMSIVIAIVFFLVGRYSMRLRLQVAPAQPMPAEIITINQEVNSLGDVCSTTDVTSGVEKPSATSIDTRVSDTAMLQVTAAHSVGDDCVATSSRADGMSKACVTSISESDVNRLTPATANSQLTAPSNIIATTSSVFEQTAGAPAAHSLPFIPDIVIAGILAKGVGATSSHLVARRGKPMPVAAGAGGNRKHPGPKKQHGASSTTSPAGPSQSNGKGRQIPNPPPGVADSTLPVVSNSLNPPRSYGSKPPSCPVVPTAPTSTVQDGTSAAVGASGSGHPPRVSSTTNRQPGRVNNDLQGSRLPTPR